MKAKFIKESESISDPVPGYSNGISWSGKDVTKAPIIGKIITEPMKFGTFEFPSEEMDVVEITGDGDIYVCNTWYKEYKHIPQIVHKKMVQKYIPIDKVSESVGSDKWEVVFRDYGDNDVVVEQKFDSEKEANDWAEDLQYDFQDEAMDDDGNECWKTFYRYFNPEDKESYVGFEVRPLK